MAAGHGPEIALEPVLTPEQLQRGTRAVDDFKLYLRTRRSREQHLEEGEILSKLIAASELSPDGGSGERVTDLELLHNCIFILNAGHETTTSSSATIGRRRVRPSAASRCPKAHTSTSASGPPTAIQRNSPSPTG